MSFGMNDFLKRFWARVDKMDRMTDGYDFLDEMHGSDINKELVSLYGAEIDADLSSVRYLRRGDVIHKQGNITFVWFGQ